MRKKKKRGRRKTGGTHHQLSPFAKLIRRERKKAGLTVTRLAVLTGINPVLLNDLDRGISQLLHRKHWPWLCRVLADLTEDRLEMEERDTNKWMWRVFSNQGTAYAKSVGGLSVPRKEKQSI